LDQAYLVQCKDSADMHARRPNLDRD